MARTDTLPHFLTDVADAIREKKGSSDTIDASDFDTEIENLPSGGGVDINDYFDVNGVQEASPAIFIVKKFPNIYISDDISNIVGLFSDLPLLEEAEITFPTNPTMQLTDASNMFANCPNLTSVTINGNPDFSIMEYMEGIFNGCTSIQQLDLSKMNCQSLVAATGLFNWCSSLEFLDVRNFDFTTLEFHEGIFGYDWEIPEANSFNPDCEIIVADQTQKDWVESNYSFLTNVKTVAEYEAE